MFKIFPNVKHNFKILPKTVQLCHGGEKLSNQVTLSPSSVLILRAIPQNVLVTTAEQQY